MITISLATSAYVIAGLLAIGMLIGWFLKDKYGSDAAAAKALENAVTGAVAEIKPVEASIKSAVGNL